jgi:hypothetical protein
MYSIQPTLCSFYTCLVLYLGQNDPASELFPSLSLQDLSYIHHSTIIVLVLATEFLGTQHPTLFEPWLLAGFLAVAIFLEVPMGTHHPGVSQSHRTNEFWNVSTHARNGCSICVTAFICSSLFLNWSSLPTIQQGSGKDWSIRLATSMELSAAGSGGLMLSNIGQPRFVLLNVQHYGELQMTLS